MFSPPEYVNQAAERYMVCDTDHARRTIALSLAAAEWCQELMAGLYGSLPRTITGRAIVREFLLRTVQDKGLASRYLAISQLAVLAEAQHLKLDGIRSQGTLFAVLPVIHRANLQGTAVDLAALLDDARQMTIAEFRAKWSCGLRRRQNCLNIVQAWIADTDRCDLLQHVRQLVEERLYELGQVVSSQPAVSGAARTKQ